MPCVLVVHLTEIAQSLYREITQKARNETQRVEHLEYRDYTTTKMSRKKFLEFRRTPSICYLWPWLGRPTPLATTQHVMHFRFVDDVMFSHNEPYDACRWHYLRGRNAAANTAGTD